MFLFIDGKFGTPSYVVNGIELINADPTFDDWIAFLDPIINGLKQ